jgi:hypothetical protein
VVVADELGEVTGAIGEAVDRPGLDAVIVPVDRGYDLEVRAAIYR